ncbi:DNA invertase Pin-like site-specific DNA recombinase [Novosphingobium kunmingense]|uniref:DNA invertase Pin-like site-specific DNA recombinase n=1 Tax=Novosphingobium kunmingense TaxID=1211806 RepID=A0A2N0H345_9SPHN|nr:recombinase family protein [Novosphingobium kunmingense]PKB13363.1 DNA invertase Pin-like site-specific DNA recombinase [Novosphingobium kunmingense]
MTARTSPRVRCAIYTRKSSEEGLEQDFNSLQAQREACAAYVKSQASEGWTLLPEDYDDGGLSGGTLERPALQRLLADIAAGLIDTVVVYKVDRLTRSLLDFSRLVETFDRHGVSFVSITQSFNTTTSMGRLTLNMLLSFAQFEREVTAERIRDKIAASKARGMWMGGIPPLGYRPDGRSLAIVDEHAALIRHIHARYLELGCVRRLAEELEEGGIRAPQRTTTKGNAYGGGVLSRGQLYFILKNPVYAGDIPHKDMVYLGQHIAIIDRETWERVQDRLRANRQGSRSGARGTSSALLAGLIVDAAGQPMIAAHSTRGTVRYRYYVSKELHHARTKDGTRVPGREIEALVRETTAQLFADPWALVAELGIPPSPELIRQLDGTCAELAQQIRARSASPLRALLREVRVHGDRLEIALSRSALARLIGASETETGDAALVLWAPYRLTRSGNTLRLVQGDGARISAAPDTALVRLIILARQWWEQLARGETDITALAAEVGYSSSYVTRVVRLAFLSPKLIETVLAGRQHSRLSPATVRSSVEMPADWDQQEALFLVH